MQSAIQNVPIDDETWVTISPTVLGGSTAAPDERPDLRDAVDALIWADQRTESDPTMPPGIGDPAMVTTLLARWQDNGTAALIRRTHRQHLQQTSTEAAPAPERQPDEPQTQPTQQAPTLNATSTKAKPKTPAKHFGFPSPSEARQATKHRCHRASANETAATRQSTRAGPTGFQQPANCSLHTSSHEHATNTQPASSRHHRAHDRSNRTLGGVSLPPSSYQRRPLRKSTWPALPAVFPQGARPHVHPLGSRKRTQLAQTTPLRAHARRRLDEPHQTQPSHRNRC